jgi:hypothetical protein
MTTTKLKPLMLTLLVAVAVDGGRALAQAKSSTRSSNTSAISAPAATPIRSPTAAAPGAAAAAASAADAPKVKVERGTGGHKVYRITEEIRIEGKIQKPEAFFFYQKSSIDFEWQELKQDFIPKIVDSVSKAPF